MSKTSDEPSYPVSKTSDESSYPKSIRHKQILDLAADQPNASIEELASEVSSATTDLVEQVLEEYGDPAESGPGAPDEAPEPTTTDASDSSSTDAAKSSGSSQSNATDSSTVEADDSSGTQATHSSMTEATDYPDPEDLPPKQRETLRAIADHPKATQRELAERLDVTAPTVGNRANAIEGFDWDDRESFAKAVFDGDSTRGADDHESIPNDHESIPNDHERIPDGEDHERISDEGDAESITKTADSDSTSQAEETASETAGEDPDSSAEAEELDQMATEQTDISTAIDQLANRLTRIEQQLEEMDDVRESSSAFTDPELVHKVVHGCLKSDAITEEEELRILSDLLRE